MAPVLCFQCRLMYSLSVSWCGHHIFCLHTETPTPDYLCVTMLDTGPTWQWRGRAMQNKRDVPIHQQACRELITHTNVWFKHSSLLCRRCSLAFVWTCGCVIIIFKSENMSCPSKKKSFCGFHTTDISRCEYWLSQWSSSLWRWHEVGSDISDSNKH